MLIFCSIASGLCALLLCLNVCGLLRPADFRNEFARPLIGYRKAIDKIDCAWAAYGATPSFFMKAVHIYANATAYQWPPGLARVRFTDNWILAAASAFDPLFRLVGLKRDNNLFSQFESYRYERALRRGFGICSENALGFADLLDRRYGIDVRLVGLRGHVVTQANLPDQQILLDPSHGLYLPFGLNTAEKLPSALVTAYEQAGDRNAANAYDSADHFVSPWSGAWGYSESQFWKQVIIRYFERAADLMKWIIPSAVLLMLALAYADESQADRRSMKFDAGQVVTIYGHARGN